LGLAGCLGTAVGAPWGCFRRGFCRSGRKRRTFVIGGVDVHVGKAIAPTAQKG